MQRYADTTAAIALPARAGVAVSVIGVVGAVVRVVVVRGRAAGVKQGW